MSLLRYVSLNTKLHAMSRDLITPAGFQRLTQCPDIPSALTELLSYRYYKNAFAGWDISALHRGDIEQILFLSSMKEFIRLYKFTTGVPRKYLNLVAMYYEIYLMKRFLRDIVSGRPLSMDLGAYRDFIQQHRKVDLDGIQNARTLQELLESMKNTPYYRVVHPFLSKGEGDIFQYELALDKYYFDICFAFAKKELKGRETKTLLTILGTRCDLLNLQWIYRTKKYYPISPASLYSILLPHYYKLSPEEIKAMTEAEGLEGFRQIFDTTYYGILNQKLFKSRPTLEEFYAGTMDYMISLTARQDPYSIAALEAYLYFRELEIETIIEIIESIRYSIPPSEIETTILKYDPRRSSP